MVPPAIGDVVLVPFPFSDLSQSKQRPAVVLASADRGDWVLCQVTSNPYGDARAVKIDDADFLSGGLRRISYARPAKLFTAHESIFSMVVGLLQPTTFQRLRTAVLDVFD